MGSFVYGETGAKTYAPGYFLASEECTRVTTEIAQAKGTTVGTTKVVKAGTVYPSNDGNAVGIVYEDVDVTNGDMPGSLVTGGVVYEDRLPAAIESTAEAVLTGIRVITTSPATTRPAWISGELIPLTIGSTASATTLGKSVVTYSGYTLKTGEKLYTNAASSTAPSVTLGQTTWTGWTEWDGTSEVSVTNDYKLSVAVADSGGAAIALGSCTAASKTS